MVLRMLALALGLFLARALANSSHHDETFTPDYVLRVTAQNISVDCTSRYSVIVNGSSPGPPLYFKEGVTTWVRVYNVGSRG